MDRRQLIKQMILVGAGSMIIPACMQNKRKPAIALKHFTISGEQESMLAELSETILPATDTPGAKDMLAHLFVLKMVDDCQSKEDQQNFLKGMDLFDKACVATTGKQFIDCTPVKRTAFTESEDKAAGADPAKHFFYSTVRKHTIQAYATSKFYLGNVLHYKLVPGKYYGCVPAKITN